MRIHKLSHADQVPTLEEVIRQYTARAESRVTPEMRQARVVLKLSLLGAAGWFVLVRLVLAAGHGYFTVHVPSFLLYLALITTFVLRHYGVPHWRAVFAFALILAPFALSLASGFGLIFVLAFGFVVLRFLAKRRGRGRQLGLQLQSMEAKFDALSEKLDRSASATRQARPTKDED